MHTQTHKLESWILVKNITTGNVYKMGLQLVWVIKEELTFCPDAQTFVV